MTVRLILSGLWVSRHRVCLWCWCFRDCCHCSSRSPILMWLSDWCLLRFRWIHIPHQSTLRCIHTGKSDCLQCSSLNHCIIHLGSSSISSNLALKGKPIQRRLLCTWIEEKSLHYRKQSHSELDDHWKAPLNLCYCYSLFEKSYRYSDKRSINWHYRLSMRPNPCPLSMPPDSKSHLNWE